MKYFVNLIAHSSVVVEANSKDEAQEIAYSDCSIINFNLEAVESVHELNTEEEISRAIRHCDEIIN